MRCHRNERILIFFFGTLFLTCMGEFWSLIRECNLQCLCFWSWIYILSSVTNFINLSWIQADIWLIYYVYCHFSICDIRCHRNGKILTFLFRLFLFSFSLSQWTTWHPCKSFLLGEVSYISWWPIKKHYNFRHESPKKVTYVMPSCTFSYSQANIAYHFVGNQA